MSINVICDFCNSPMTHHINQYNLRVEYVCSEFDIHINPVSRNGKSVDICSSCVMKVFYQIDQKMLRDNRYEIK